MSPMRLSMGVVICTAVIGIWVACSPPPSEQSDCTPGEVTECACPGDDDEIRSGMRVCEPEERWGDCICGDDDPEECDGADDCEDGEVCVAGSCQPDDEKCTPDQRRCTDDGNTIEICADDGSEWLQHATCSETESCVDGICTTDGEMVCDPGELRCSGDGTAVEVCTDGGTGWETQKPCDAGECVDDACQIVGDGDHAETSIFAGDVQAHIDRYNLPEPPDWDDLSVSRTVDAVDDMGLDNTGTESIVDAFNSQIDNGDEVVFPDGEYLVDGMLVLPDVSAIRPVDGESGDVTFVLDDNTIDHPTFNAMGNVEFGIKHVTIDEQNDNTLAEIGATCDDILYIRDIEFVGFSDENPDDGGWKLTPNILESDGVGIVRDVVATGGTVLGASGVGHNSHKQHWAGGSWAGPNHEGTMYMVDNEMANWTDGALYMSRTQGPVVVAGGFYANSSGELVRLGSPQSFVGGGVDLVVDDAYASPENDFEHIVNPRPIWLEDRANYPDHFGYVADVNIRIDESTPTNVSGGIVVQSSVGGGVIEGPVDIQVDRAGVPLLRAISPDGGSNSYVGEGGSVSEVDVVVDDFVGRSSADGNVMVLFDDRPGSVFENGCLQETAGQGKNGIIFSGDDTDSVAQDTAIAVSGQPVIGGTSTNIDEQGDCQPDVP